MSFLDSQNQQISFSYNTENMVFVNEPQYFMWRNKWICT